MTSKAFNKIKAGLEDALAYSRGEKSRGRTHRVVIKDVDVRKLRTRLALSQNEFAARLGLKPSTVRNWEQKRRRPEGPARALLQIIAHDPVYAMKALLG
jgi:putative transcriptional regulator